MDKYIFGHLLVPGQVENFTISTPLLTVQNNNAFLHETCYTKWLFEAIVKCSNQEIHMLFEHRF